MAEKKKPLISEVAAEIVLGPRAAEYGHPKINITAIAEVWTTYLRAKEAKLGGASEITPHDVCQMMILLKSMRAAQGYARDTTIDIAGYAQVDAVVCDDDKFPE